MKALYSIPSGNFAGWKDESSNRLYDSNGDNVGYFINDIAYSLDGEYIGEITREDYIGIRIGSSYPLQSSVVPYIGISRIPSVDRIGMAVSGWEDPDFA